MSNDEYTLKEMLTEMRLDMRELREEVRSISNRQIVHEEVGIKTLEQTTKTNGRVTKLEVDVSENKREISNFKTIATTVASVAGIIWTGVTFIFK